MLGGGGSGYLEGRTEAQNGNHATWLTNMFVATETFSRCRVVLPSIFSSCMFLSLVFLPRYLGPHNTHFPPHPFSIKTDQSHAIHPCKLKSYSLSSRSFIISFVPCYGIKGFWIIKRIQAASFLSLRWAEGHLMNLHWAYSVHSHFLSKPEAEDWVVSISDHLYSSLLTGTHPVEVLASSGTVPLLCSRINPLASGAMPAAGT